MAGINNVLALSGGVGGAKLALGLSKCLAPEALTVVANTGDDFVHLDFPVSPDIDTLMYTLAGLSNQEQGWGLQNESWQFMDAMSALGGETWFRLGDRDIATHTLRRQLLGQGASLETVTRRLCAALGVQHTVVPMTNDAVSTQVFTAQGWLDFQDYFVRQQCAPEVTEVRFSGRENASPSAAFDDWLTACCSDDSALSAVIICPSNPFLSVDPILSLPTVLPKLKECLAPIIAVSPIVDGQAIKGPTANMMSALGMPVTVLAIAEYYRDIIDGLVIDATDQGQAEAIEALGIKVRSSETVMTSVESKVSLARVCLEFCAQLGGG